ncbi:MAG: S8 family serine peptidase [Candidatus Eisenbacteria sp.]|nr:S8 family serine peptidase [Candidatus Eisenbacteria bacterium]
MRCMSIGLAWAMAILLPAVAAQAAHPGATTRPYWVFLADRGSAPEVDSSALSGLLDDGDRILAIADRLPPEAWARRARASATGTALPDARDFQLCEAYVAQVAEFGHLRHRSRWLNAVSIELTPGALPRVCSLPFVIAVRPVAIARRTSIGPGVDDEGRPLEVILDPRRRATRAGAELAYGTVDYGLAQWQLEEIGVPPVHALGYSGNGLRFMMLDTGFRKDHQAFDAVELLGQWDFIFEDGDVQNEPEDLEWQHNHGTGTWSAAGAYAPGIVVGPAYGATFYLAKTEDVGSETQAEEDNYVAALEWADAQGVVLTSASLCYVCFDDSFCYTFPEKDGDTAVISVAVDIAASRGILCVNSQGNYACDTGSLGTPADADSMIAVGAVDSLNQIASFSACGPTYDGRIKPEVLARGVLTHVAYAAEPDAYGRGSGTSYSAPLVAGAAALLLEAHPEWDPMDVREALMQTADRAALPDTQWGWGRINTAAALTYTPILYPYPFSLVTPADSAETAAYRPAFTWHQTSDPDNGDPLAYTLWIENTADPLQQWSLPAGGDTTLALPFALSPDLTYRWWVTAEDLGGHRRTSREAFVLFLNPDPSDVAEDAGAPAAAIGTPLRLRCLPNPFVGSLHLRIDGAGGAISGPVLGSSNGRSSDGPSDGPSANLPPQWAVYDPLGRRIAHGLAGSDGEQFSATWDGWTRFGRPAAPGVYYLEVRHGYQTARRTIVRLAP